VINWHDIFQVAQATENRPILAFLNKAHDDQVTEVYKFFFMNDSFKLALMEAGQK